MTGLPPRRLFAFGRWLLARRLPTALADEADGDLRELWVRRAEAGRRGLRLAYARDLASLLWRRRRPVVYEAPDRGLSSIRRVLDMRQDIRLAFRLIRRQPLSAALTITTLALGIAASTGIFTTVDRLLLQPLPYPEPDRLVAVENIAFSFAGDGMDVPRAVRALPVFDGIGVYASGGLNIDQDGRALRLPAAVVSPGFFEAMTVVPQVGRVYTYEDVAETGHAVAVISDGLWRRLFNADTAVLDRPLYVNRRAFRILGVMPSGFSFPGTSDIWIPVFSDRQATGAAFAPAVVGRLSRGTTAAAAVAALERYHADRGAPPPEDESQRVRVTSLQADLTKAVRPTLLLLAMCVGLVLLVATTNVAGLLLARVTRRQSEYVVRRALGGSQWRLMRLLGVEALVLAGLAGVIGTALGTAALRLVAGLSVPGLPALDLSLDGRMLAMASAVSVVAGLLFGLAPGLAAASQAPADVVRSSATSTAAPRWRRMRHALVVVQVAAALVLLAVTTSAIRTLVRLSWVDLGFRPASALGFTVTLPITTYGGIDPIARFADEALAHLRSQPGVVAAGATGRLPGDSTVGTGLRLLLPGESPEDAPRRSVSLLAASPDYFKTMGIPVVAGRDFTDADRQGAEGVIILSESAVALVWPDGRSPIGQAVVPAGPRLTPMTVVGIVPDVLLHGPVGPSNPAQMYRPVAQQPPFGSLSFAVRTLGDPAALAATARRAIAEVDATLPPYGVRLLEDVVSDFLVKHRLAMSLLGIFAGLTILLSAIGLYGVLAQVVAQRSRELGIRMALGADGSRLQRSVVWSGLKVAVAGTAAGLLATGLAARAIGAFVPDLDPLPWPMIAGNVVLMLAVAAAAAWIPARRAATVDVARTLRA